MFDNIRMALPPRNAPIPTVIIVAGKPSSISSGPSQLAGSVRCTEVGGMVTFTERHADAYAAKTFTFCTSK